jgi:hypothetical protein
MNLLLVYGMEKIKLGKYLRIHVPRGSVEKVDAR